MLRKTAEITSKILQSFQTNTSESSFTNGTYLQAASFRDLEKDQADLY